MNLNIFLNNTYRTLISSLFFLFVLFNSNNTFSQDTDDDGINNNIDIDDDNDGILDFIENQGCTSPTVTFLNTPIAYWNLNNTTNDSVGTFNEGSGTDSPSFSTDAIEGSHSASFDGNNNEIRYSVDGGFMETTVTSISFSAWIKPFTISGQTIIYEEGGGTHGAVLWIDNGVLTFSTRNNSVQRNVTHPSILVVKDLWYHVAATFNSGILKVYLNGSPVTNDISADYTQIPTHTGNGGLGGSLENNNSAGINTDNSNYEGLIDAARYSNAIVWTDTNINTEATLTGCDNDNDSIVNSLDIDSDNDGIPDNLEAQTTSGYTPPSGTGNTIVDDNNNGLDDNYETIDDITDIYPINTESTGLTDYLDTNSEGDSLLDIEENGDLDNETSGVDTDGDGLDDNFDNFNDTSISGFTVNNGINPPNGANLGDENSNLASGGDVDYREYTDVDTDGDGIFDSSDIDDDNDGILDINECVIAETGLVTDEVVWNGLLNSYPVYSFLEDFESYSDNTDVTSLTFTGFSITASPTTLTIGGNTYASNPNSGLKQVRVPISNGSSDNVITINFNQPVAGFAIAVGDLHDGSNTGSVFTVSFNGTDIWSSDDFFSGGSQSGIATNDIDGITTAAMGNNQYSIFGYYDPSNPITTATIRMSGVGTGDNFVFDDISYIESNVCPDSDGDGIPNGFDLDSDNDGIPDNIEGQSTINYIAPSGLDSDNDGLDDAYDSTPNGSSDGSGSIGITPVNTDNSALSGSDIIADYLDLDSDGDGLFDINESGSGLTDIDNDGQTDGDVGKNGLDNILDNDGTDNDGDGNDADDNYVDINGNFDASQTNNFTDTDNDATSPLGDLDYRDTLALGTQGTPMITQVYKLGTESWIEITNISTTNSIDANLIKVQLYSNKTGEQTDINPDASYTVPSILSPGQSVLINNTVNMITNLNTATLNFNDNTLTSFDSVNNIITLSKTTDNTSWENKYDVISDFDDNTSHVRIDETISPNNTYDTSEWVVFIDDTLDPYQLLGAGGVERHPHDPLISEIVSSNIEANTQLGLHRINITTRTGNNWDNGFPDRSRFVVIDQDYNHNTVDTKLSARKLTVNTSNTLSITDNLLIVTNSILLNGDIRLIDPNMNGLAQLIQTHTSETLVTGTGRILVDQNSSVPSKFRYNYIASPVIATAGATSYTVADILKDGTTTTNNLGIIGTDIAKDINWISGYDGNFISDPISLAHYWVYTYAASSGTRASWVQKFSTGNIPNTDGFIFKGPGRVQNYTFMGIPKDGNLTTTIGKDESYLVGNPYGSSLSVKKFIEDNIEPSNTSINGTLYFWEHVSEQDDSSTDTSGHNFAGYIGGYATINLLGGVTAKDAAAASSGAIDINLQAETATISGATIESVSDDGTNIDVVRLDAISESVTFKGITSGVDTLRVRYKAANNTNIEIKENNGLKQEFQFVSTNGEFDIAIIPICIVIGSDLTFETTSIDVIEIDYLNLKDNGTTSCAPITGTGFTYTEPKEYIAIGQGFFVQGDETDGGTIVFNNSQREYKTEVTESVFFKSSSKKTDTNSTLDIPVIKLGMNFNSITNNEMYHRQIAVGFTSFTSFAFDNGYDSEIYDIGNTDFYWKFPTDDKKYVIAGVQAISDDLEIPIEITMGYSGEVTIELDEMKNINKTIYITDKITEVSYDIINNKATLNLDAGIYTNRFILTFKPYNTLSNDDFLENNHTIYVDNNNNKLVITKDLDIDIINVELYNILGKKVSFWNIEEQKSLYQLDILTQIPTGIYIIKLNTNKGEINKKIIIE